MRIEAFKMPSSTVAQEAKEALRSLASAAKRPSRARVRVQLEGEAAEVAVTVPREAFELLLEVLSQMANGNAVTIVPVHAELTTHQAGELLNVSRPYLIGLLEAGKIPFRMVGTHRRIRFADLMEFKRKDDAERDAALAELTRQAQDLGLGY